MYETNFNKAAFCAFALSSMQAFAWDLQGTVLLQRLRRIILMVKREDILSISLEKKDWLIGQTGRTLSNPIQQVCGNPHLHGIM